MAIYVLDSRSLAALHSPTFFGENVCPALSAAELKKIDKHLGGSYYCLGSHILLIGCDVCFSTKAESVNLSFQYIFFLALLALALQLRVLVIVLEMCALPTKLLPRERLLIRAPPHTNYPLDTA